MHDRKYDRPVRKSSMYALGGAAILLCLNGCVESVPEHGHSRSSVALTNAIFVNAIFVNAIFVNAIFVNALTARAITTSTIHFNGLSLSHNAANGLSVSGTSIGDTGLDGLKVNGGGSDGVVLNGIRLSGTKSQDLGTSGAGQSGAGMFGYGINGLYIDGLGTRGIAVNGVGLRGVGLNGPDGRGLVVGGTGRNNIGINYTSGAGAAANGIVIHGASDHLLGDNGGSQPGLDFTDLGINGLFLDGAGTGSLVVGGAGLVDAGLDGLEVNGSGANALEILNGDGSSVELSDEQEIIAQFAMYYLAACALSDGDSISLTLTDGTVQTFSGKLGYAPEWKSGPVSQSGAEDVRACIVSSRGSYENGPLTGQQETILELALYHLVGCALPQGHSVTITAQNGTPKTYHGVRGFAPEWETGPLTAAGEENVRACLESSPTGALGLLLNTTQQAAFDFLLSYAVQCALDAEQSVTVYAADGTPTVYDGAMGLAPEWSDSGLTASGKRRVTACLAARTNANGQTVSISLRGSGVATTPVERAVYSRHEGSFWGDAFGDDPQISTCSVEGLGFSGRVCTSGICGFEAVGDCASVCASQSTEDGAYTDCDGEFDVVNTFLMVTDQVAFGASNNCYRKTDGSLYCWGENASGELGNGTTTPSTTPQMISILATMVAEVAGGNSHTCARKRDGSVFCWGSNASGQMGNGTTGGQMLNPAKVVPLGYDAASLAVGSEHTCVLRTDAKVFCWGGNVHGQIGDGTTTTRTLPVEISGLGGTVTRVVLGEGAEHTCAIDSAGDLRCWGRGDSGQLGDGSQVDRHGAVLVAEDHLGNGLPPITDACTGAQHTCARADDGSVYCWGANDKGQLGDPDVTSSVEDRPVRVALAGQVAQGGLSCATDHACAITDDGSVSCWGGNAHGQLGNGSYAAEGSATPVQVVGLPEDAVAITADASHTCVTLSDESVWCFGQDEDGMLFESTASHTPIELAIP